MAEFARRTSEAALHKVKSFLSQTIGPMSSQIHPESRHANNELCRNVTTLRNGHLPYRLERSLSPGALREITHYHPRPVRRKSFSSEQARANIAHISTIADRVSTKSYQQTLQHRRQSYHPSDYDDEEIDVPEESKTPTQKPSPKRRTKLAALILVGGTLFGVFQRDFIEVVRDQFLVVEKNNFFTNIWSDVPIGVNLCIYAFSLKNGRAYYKGAKPNLEKLGPYCYRAYRKREFLEWKEKTVTFYESFRLEFNPDNSASLDKDITSINLPIYGAILFTKELLSKLYLKFAGPIVYNIINVALQTTGERPIERFSVGEYMNGRKINAIVLLDKILDPMRRMGIPIPDYAYGGYKIVNQSYGIASLINAAKMGPMEAYRRSEDGKHVGDIVGLQGETTWPGIRSPCNRVESSDGVFFPRPVTQKELTIFFYIACRLIKIVKLKEHYHYGALLTRYMVDKKMFSMKDENNHCFCRKGLPISACEGLSDMSPCFFGAPIEFSEPNFIHYPNLQRQVNGLEPDIKKYDGFVDIDPYLGSPVNVKLFVQGNLHMSRISSVSVLANIREGPLPILLIEVVEGMDNRPWLIPVVFILSNYLRYAAFLWFSGSAFLAAIIAFRRKK